MFYFHNNTQSNQRRLGIIPPKLKPDDEIRVIAPAESLSPKFKMEMRQRARKKLESLGLRVSFGNYIDERDNFDTGSVRHRLEDLHNAVSDPNVKAIIAANGGSSANQLLKHIDYNLLWQHPKIFCGLSDITELTSAIYAKTGLVTYYGPHFTMIGATHLIDHSIENMKKTFFSEDPFPL